MASRSQELELNFEPIVPAYPPIPLGSFVQLPVSRLGNTDHIADCILSVLVTPGTCTGLTHTLYAIRQGLGLTDVYPVNTWNNVETLNLMVNQSKYVYQVPPIGRVGTPYLSFAIGWTKGGGADPTNQTAILFASP